MKQNCIKTVAISLLVTLSLSINASTRKVNVARSVMVGNGNAKFVPDGFDAKKEISPAVQARVFPALPNPIIIASYCFITSCINDLYETI